MLEDDLVMMMMMMMVMVMVMVMAMAMAMVMMVMMTTITTMIIRRGLRILGGQPAKNCLGKTLLEASES